MRIRSVVALIFTVAVMACQTVAGPGSGARPAAPAYASAVSASETEPAIVNGSVTYARAASPAADAGSKRKTILIVAIAAAVVIAGVILLGGSDGSSY